MLELMVERLRDVSLLDEIVIATTTNSSDNPIVELADRLKIGVWRGSEHNVMDRVLSAAQHFHADVIVELTGDCPLIDPDIVQACILQWKAAGADYLANCLERSFPIGMDTQVFWTKTLADAAARTHDPHDQEHVSLFIYRNPTLYKLVNITAPEAQRDPELRLTLDTQDDYNLIQNIYNAFYVANPKFRLDDILNYLRSNPELRMMNSHVKHRYV